MARRDPLAALFEHPRLVSICAIDPSLTRTGVCVISVPALWDLDRLKLVPAQRRVTWLGSAPHRESRGGFAPLFAEVIKHLPVEQPLIWGLEWPPPKKVGQKNTSHEAAAIWRQFIVDHSRRRWLDANPGKGEDAKSPDATRALFDPSPEEWRGPIGVATKGVGRTEAERAAWIKGQSMAYAWRELEARGRWAGSSRLVRVDEQDQAMEVPPIIGVDEDGSDEEVNSDIAEAVCIGTWLCRNVGTIGTWIRAGGKPKLLRAVI